MNAPPASLIHTTAIVDPAARLAADVEVGPYTIIGPHVEIGAGSRIGPHTVITGHTRIGAKNTISQFVSVGDAPQDKKYGGEPTRLEIGDGNTIRECCTINRGTIQGGGVTRVGNDNWIMAYVHIAHDCRVGNRAIFANSAQLAGHVLVDDDAVLGGFTGGTSILSRRGSQHYGSQHGGAAGHPAVRDRLGQPGASIRHQQRRIAAARLFERDHFGTEARLQNTVSRGSVARRSAARACGPRRAMFGSPTAARFHQGAGEGNNKVS